MNHVCKLVGHIGRSHLLKCDQFGVDDAKGVVRSVVGSDLIHDVLGNDAMLFLSGLEGLY